MKEKENTVMRDKVIESPSMLVELGDVKTLTFGSGQKPQDANVCPGDYNVATNQGFTDQD